MTPIGVKSKYGSCSRNCTGLININNFPHPKKHLDINYYPFVSLNTEKKDLIILFKFENLTIICFVAFVAQR